MRLSSRLCALTAAAGIALAGLAAPGALAVPGRLAAKVRIHLVAIDRSGRKTAVFAVIYTRQQHGTSWHATVRDPASGFVSLRSTVTDSAGDRSTETIYRAYSIASV